MKYYRDASGNYLGGWDENPPAGAREVPLPPADARQVWGGGQWRWPLEAARAEKIALNNAAYEAALGALTADYPPSEIATWERQRAEALAWEADPQAPTPWIDTAALARQLDREVYLTRTVAKVHAFAQASAYFTGRRQFIDDAIRATETAEDLADVQIDYTLPGAP